MKYFYARVSTKEQKLSRQIDIFKKLGADDRTIFQEKQSGKNFENRAVWNDLINRWIRPGDTIVVKNFDRLGRNKKEVKQVMIDLAKQRIYIESIDQAYLNNYIKDRLAGDKENDSYTEAMKDFFFELMLDMDLLRAEWERKETAKRRDEGIASAKKRGVKFGRPLDKNMRNKFKELYPLTRNKDSENYMSVTSLVKILGCSRTHFYYMEKLLKENKL